MQVLGMDSEDIEAVCPERTVRAPLFRFRREHEMIDEELTAPIEQIAQRFGALRPLECVPLVDTLPRQCPPSACQLVSRFRERSLLLEQRDTRLQPVLVRYHRMHLDWPRNVARHGTLSSSWTWCSTIE